MSRLRAASGRLLVAFAPFEEPLCWIGAGLAWTACICSPYLWRLL